MIVWDPDFIGPAHAGGVRPLAGLLALANALGVSLDRLAGRTALDHPRPSD